MPQTNMFVQFDFVIPNQLSALGEMYFRNTSFLKVRCNIKTPLKICFYIKVHIRFIVGVILSFLYSQLENIKKT